MNVDERWVSAQFADIADLQRVASGGQKAVFSGHHPTEGDVVVKLVHPAQDPERIRREILAVQLANTRRVPKVLATGTLRSNVGEIIWIREQRIDGESLRAIINRGERLSTDLLVLATQVLEVLADVERVQIVHRDIKPDNIIRDTTGEFWVIDFGIARHLQLPSVTPSAAPFGVGTVGYAPPEQFRNRKRDIDARADLFALGVTLYECATGENPFRAGARDQMEILRNVEQMPLPPLNLQNDSAGLVREFVAVLTQKRADHRPLRAVDALSWGLDILDDISPQG